MSAEHGGPKESGTTFYSGGREFLTYYAPITKRQPSVPKDEPKKLTRVTIITTPAKGSIKIIDFE